MRRIDHVILHATDSRWADPVEVDAWHSKRGFSYTHQGITRSIGYHFLIGNGHPTSKGGYREETDGLIWPGRPLEIPGAHVRGHNKHSIGVCLVGRSEYFTARQERASHGLVARLCLRFSLSVDAVIGHYELDGSKTCPELPMSEYRHTIYRMLDVVRGSDALEVLDG